MKLLRTVRANIGECAAAAYRTLTIAAASEILMFNSSQVSRKKVLARLFFHNDRPAVCKGNDGVHIRVLPSLGNLRRQDNSL